MYVDSKGGRRDNYGPQGSKSGQAIMHVDSKGGGRRDNYVPQGSKSGQAIPATRLPIF